MQLDELGHIVDHGFGVAQLAEPLAAHGRSDDLVVVEGHGSGTRVAPRPRLADVVQQRGQPGDQIGAAEAIFQPAHVVQH